MDWLSMIVISTYNPERPRTTEDEELLTTMLQSLVFFRGRSNLALKVATEETDKEHHLRQVKNSDRLIGMVYPLLGLDITEVYGLIQDWGQG